MDERFVKKLIAPSFVIVVLSTIFFYEFKYLIDNFLFKKKHMLIIGILSAPENFQQRLSIRKTWLQLLSEISASSYFIVGNEICEVPHLDRPDPYSCTSQPFALPSNVTTDFEFSTMEVAPNVSQTPFNMPNYVGFGIYVRSQIKVKKLGILKNLIILLNCEVHVKLISAVTKKVLGSVTFGPLHLNETDSDMLLVKAIKPINLYGNSEAIVKMETRGVSHVLLPECKTVTWSDGPNVITYINLWEGDSSLPSPFTKKSCTYVSLHYSIVDLETIKTSIKNKNLRLKEWRLQNKKLSLKLNDESKTYRDIMFLDVVDVYRNITLKLIHFYKRVLETEYFHYILKTDDDCFVDLLRIYNQLKLASKELDGESGVEGPKYKEIGFATKRTLSKFWWWSFFREFWKVQHAGKWRESQYRAASYPSFPCGGGYVINRGIAEYIISNELNLNHFQGEDVSMGIWLSSLSVTQYKTPSFVYYNESHDLQRKIFAKFKIKQHGSAKFKTENKRFPPDFCEWTCDNSNSFKLPSCNKIQLSVKDMYETWNDYTNNGFL